VNLTVYLLLAVVVGVVGTARLTRLVVDDTWPPVAALRDWWDRRTNTSGWNDLLHCPWCVSMWFAPPCLAWAWLTDLHWSWWVFYGWLAGAYAAGAIVVRDEPPESRA
jgi:hypothetical protein